MSKREFKEPLITVFTPSYNRAHTLPRTYESLKDDYLSLKAILNVAGINLTDIDKIKE